MYVITGIEKEKQVITINLEDDKQIIVNLGERTVRNITKRKIAYVKIPLTLPAEMSKYDIFINIISRPVRWLDLEKLETFWSVLELIDNVPNENPKGYIKYVRENGKRISDSTLKEFKAESRLEGLSELNKADWELITRYVDNFCHSEDFSKEDIEKICKIFRNSIKNKNRIFRIKDDMNNLFAELMEYNYREYNRTGMWEHLDTERDAQYNINKWDMIQNADRNAKIIDNESIIAPIMQIETDTLSVIVPLEIQQFTDEGEQQRNCVGHFYHDRIAEGRTFIYFIRRKKNKNKSYVTCRYDRIEHQTVEHRLFVMIGAVFPKLLNLLQELMK